MGIKRAFDVMACLAGLTMLSPLLLVVGLGIKTDGGPVFFRQARVGHKGNIFHIFKFRSMVPDADKLGGLVTAQYDPRITRVGRFLRNTKLDELPQLFNVLTGDMSLVGPRPEVPYYVEMWPEDARREILSVRPGITDYATLFYNDEQAVLGKSADPERVYVNEILPHKLELYKKYVADQTFSLDFRILVATLLKMAGARPDRVVPEIRFSGVDPGLNSIGFPEGSEQCTGEVKMLIFGFRELPRPKGWGDFYFRLPPSRREILIGQLDLYKSSGDDLTVLFEKGIRLLKESSTEYEQIRKFFVNYEYETENIAGWAAEILSEVIERHRNKETSPASSEVTAG